MDTNVEQLESLRQLRHTWRMALFDAVDTFLPVLLMGPLFLLAIINFAGSFVTDSPTSIPAACLLWFVTRHPVVQVLFVLAITIVICAPLIVTAVGRYPTQEEIDLQQRLRRSLGLSDEIATD